MKKLLILLLFSSVMFGQLTHKIGKAKTNFVTTPPSSLNESGLVFAYTGDQPINKTIVDASGNGNNGTLNGGVMYAGGVDGGLQFNGRTGTNVGIADKDAFTTSTFTIEHLLIPKSLSTAIGFASKFEANQYEYLAYVQADGSLQIFLVSNNLFANRSVYQTIANLITTNRQYHIILLVNGATVEVYINGVKYAVTKTDYGTGFTGFTNTTARYIIGYTSGTGLADNSIHLMNKFYSRLLPATEIKDKWNKIASKPYIIEDFSDGTVGKFPRDWTRVSGTHVIATGTPKYLNCTSAGNLYFTTRDNASSCYMTYDYYTSGAWTSKAGLVSALSTAEATMDYNATNRKLTFIMGTNDRVRNIKIIRAQAQ